MAVHARLKNEFTEDKMFHNLMSWFKYHHDILWQPCFIGPSEHEILISVFAAEFQ